MAKKKSKYSQALDPKFKYGKDYYGPESFKNPLQWAKNTAMVGGSKLKSALGFSKGGRIKGGGKRDMFTQQYD